ncbi:hypothetical protein C5167_048988 [Papaver somniferum]|uniref:Sulfotransferase n=1 Tax=Papaver somniferum TaxID=3469 RepID=A0A4Y7KN35_PAPSO|nr:hypothetical protein C5167_048988 [Papaver somniferum]
MVDFYQLTCWQEASFYKERLGRKKLKQPVIYEHNRMASKQSKDSKLHGCEEADGQFTQETRDLLSSMPKQKAWVRSDHIYQYQNFWYGAAELQGVINVQRNFKALDSDLIVATYPKCGTTWLKALPFAIMNKYHFNTATLKQNHPLLTINPHLLLPFLDNVYSTDKNPDLACFSVNNLLLATHFPLASLFQCIKDSKCKLVYICRDPKDTVVSYWHFIAKIRTKNMENISLEEFYKQFCDGVVEYGSFWDHVLGLAQFLGYPFSAEEENEGVVEELLKLCSFDHLSNLEANKNGKVPVLEIGCSAFFRRGEVGDHVNYLTPAMIERLDKITEEKFSVMV